MIYFLFLVWANFALGTSIPQDKVCYDPGSKVAKEMATPETPSKEERVCDRDDECTFVLGVCGHCVMAVNKKSVPKVQKRIDGRNDAVTCQFGNPPPPKPKCQRRLCVVLENP